MRPPNSKYRYSLLPLLPVPDWDTLSALHYTALETILILVLRGTKKLETKLLNLTLT